MPRDTVKTNELRHGHKTVGAAAVKLTDLSFSFIKGVLLRCPGADDPTPNTTCVWVGGAAVTADSDGGTGGIPIGPGESIVLPVVDPSDLYVVSDAASQDVAWLGV
jgi:hypothetical protein